ncbi:choice-of-anchor K domain-containing protein [Planctomycetota bacterium]|nr:choice-of-anchor K domain-containing protein [Planctomycetota bacterium]
MKIKHLHRNIFFALAAAVVVVGASTLSAATFNGRSELTFDINDEANPNAVYDQFSDRGLRLGENPAPNYTVEDTSQSLYGYYPVDVDESEAFQIGGVTHWNGRTVEGTSPDSIVFNVNLDLGAAGNQTFTFDVNYTQGDGTASDVYSIPDSALSQQTFEINGTTYALELLGFGQNPGNLNADFITGTEYTNSKTGVYGQFVEIPSTVPTPAAAAFGLAGLSLLSLRRNRNKRATQ